MSMNRVIRLEDINNVMCGRLAKEVVQNQENPPSTQVCRKVKKMGRIKPRGRYLAISVQIALHAEIKEHISQSSYNSIAEFVKDAVREKIDEDRFITKKYLDDSLKKLLGNDI